MPVWGLSVCEQGFGSFDMYKHFPAHFPPFFHQPWSAAPLSNFWSFAELPGEDNRAVVVLSESSFERQRSAWSELCLTSAGFGRSGAGSTVYPLRREVDAVDGRGRVWCNRAVFAGSPWALIRNYPYSWSLNHKSLFWIRVMTWIILKTFVSPWMSSSPSAHSSRPTDSCCHLLNKSPCSGCLLKTRGRISKDCQDCSRSLQRALVKWHFPFCLSPSAGSVINL